MFDKVIVKAKQTHKKNTENNNSIRKTIKNYQKKTIRKI